MKRFIAASALVAATISGVRADLCSEGSTDIDGNWFCQAVTGIVYTGVGPSDSLSYQKVTTLEYDGTCDYTAQSYTGTMAPLDEEVSLHFRGPIQLNNFAAYTPSSSSSKKHKRSVHRHGHAHLHKKEQREARAAVAAKRQVGATVTYTDAQGAVETWINTYDGSSSDADSDSAVASTTSVAVAEAVVATSAASSAAASSTAAATSEAAAASTSSTSSTSSSGSWSRQAYYDASSASSGGLVFLNHNGAADVSGNWTSALGSSLSYSDSTGTKAATSSTILDSTELPSDTEVVIMSSNACDGDCGTTFPGGVAYHGFDGAEKAFVFNFIMPHDSTGSANVDMPAIWMLNAQIPLTQQYGSCSCWESGCGEFDIFEVLSSTTPASTYAKSTLHGNINGGDSDYFARPVDSAITVAVVLYNNNIHLQVLSDDWDFSSSEVDFSAIDAIITATTTQSSDVSVFALAA